VEKDIITCFGSDEPVSLARVEPFDVAKMLGQGAVGQKAGWALHRDDYPGVFPFQQINVTASQNEAAPASLANDRLNSV
jgi:hypothetical protein